MPDVITPPLILVTFVLTSDAPIFVPRPVDNAVVVAKPVEPSIVNDEAYTDPSLYTLNGADALFAPAQITILLASGTPTPDVKPVLFVVIVASDEFKESVPAAVVLNIVDEFTSHKPISADAVVSFPVVASMVVIPDVAAELNVNPEEFNIYPAPERDPPVSPVAVTVLPVKVPLYKDAPLAILTLPLNDPFLALRSPSITKEDPFHSI